MKRQQKINQVMDMEIFLDTGSIMKGTFRVKATGDMILITGNPKNVVFDYREPKKDAK